MSGHTVQPVDIEAAELLLLPTRPHTAHAVAAGGINLSRSPT